MRQNESIVVVVTCRRRLGAGVAAAGRGCARARGAAASEFVRLVCPHEESANVDKEGCSSLAAARGAARRGGGGLPQRSCSWLSSTPRFRRAIESSKYWMHQRQRARAARVALWEQRRRCAPECRRASPTKPGVRLAPAARRRHACGARGGGAARAARARAWRGGGMSGRLKTNGRNGSGRGQTYARPGICTRIDARFGARKAADG